MKLRNCVILTDEDSLVTGFRPVDGMDGYDKHDNVMVTDEEVSERIRERLHAIIDEEFGVTEPKTEDFPVVDDEILVNEADFNDWLYDQVQDDELFGYMADDAHDKLFS